MSRNARALLAAIVLFAGFLPAGCMVGPDYATPDVQVAEGWLDVKNGVSSRPDENAQWWRSFNDPILDALVEQAPARNLTLREAGLRVIEARGAGTLVPDCRAESIGLFSASPRVD